MTKICWKLIQVQIQFKKMIIKIKILKEIKKVKKNYVEKYKANKKFFKNKLKMRTKTF